MKEQDRISSQRGAGTPEARISSKLQRTLCQGVAVAALAIAFAPSAANALICVSINPILNGSSDAGNKQAVACGNSATANGNYDVAAGSGATTNGGGTPNTSSVAVGGNANANAADTIAIGGGALANSAWDTSVGARSYAKGGGSIDFGATAFGSWSQATNMGSTALGQFSQAKPSNADIGGGSATTPDNTNPIIPTSGPNANKLAGKPVDPSASLSTAVGNWTIAAGYNSTAVGQLAATNADNATALGQFAYATASNASAVGQGSQAFGDNSTALGSGAVAGSAFFNPGAPNKNWNGNIPYTTGVGTAGDTAAGYFSTAIGGSSTAIGGTDAKYNQITGVYTGANAAMVDLGATSGVAVGGGATNGNGAYVSQGSVGGVAIGGGSNGQQGATAGFNLLKYYQGNPAYGAAPGAIAIGGSDGVNLGASAANAGDVSIGTLSSAIGGGSPTATPGSCGKGVAGVCGGSATALGYEATAWYQGSTAIGNYSYAIGKDANGGFATAVGNYAWVADVNNGTAIGQFSFVKGENGTAVGQASHATAVNSSAFGQTAWAAGDNSTALGTGAYAGSASLDPSYKPGSSTTGVGTANDVAVGYFSTAAGGNSTAIGTNSQAYGQNSIAIGANAVANNANQVVLGAPGVLQASTGSQVGPTNFVTSDANGTLGTSQFGPGSIAALNASVSNLYLGQASLQQQINGNRREARQGIAIAYVGGANAPMPSAPGKVTYILNAGGYKNQGAIAGALSYRLPTSFPLALTAGVSVGFNSSAAAKGGLQGEF